MKLRGYTQDAERFSDIDRAAVQAIREESCPGHIASESDPKICGRCGVHIDSLRPPPREES